MGPASPLHTWYVHNLHFCTNTSDLLSAGWKKKLAYCIAFSADGAQDVTRRYVRNFAKYGLPRTKASESALLHIIAEIKTMRRRDMDKSDKFRLEGEDIREDKEFRQNVIEALGREICRMLPGRPDPDMLKAQERAREAQAARARNSRNAQHFNPRDQQQR